MTDSISPRRALYCLHGFSFYNSEERQRVAEAHPIWPDFVRYYSRAWGTEKPSMDDGETRTFYEFFIEGGMAQANFSVAQSEPRALWIAGKKPDDDAVEKCAVCGRYPFEEVMESHLTSRRGALVCAECLAFESTETLDNLAK